VSVLHHGFRGWREGRQLIHRYWYGTGAMLAKYCKWRPWAVAPLLWQLFWRWAFGRSRVAASLGHQQHRIFRLIAFGQGFLAGWRTPMGRATGHFCDQAQSTRRFAPTPRPG
jgi:hypothetical protein